MTRTITELQAKKLDLYAEIKSIDLEINEIEHNLACVFGDHVEVRILYDRKSETIAVFCVPHQKQLGTEEAIAQMRVVASKPGWVIPF